MADLKQLIKILFGIFSLIITLFGIYVLVMFGFYVYDYRETYFPKYPSSDRFIDKIYKTVSDGDIIFLDNYTNFEWDNVFFGGYGTSATDGRSPITKENIYISILGEEGMFPYESWVEVIIFRKRQEVVKVIVRERDTDRPFFKVEIERNPGPYGVYNRDDAWFKVERGKEGTVKLSPINEALMEY